MLFSDSYPPVPLSTWKGGERIAPVSASIRAQAENAEGGLNENIGKTPAGVLPIFSFAREARRTAPFQGSYVLAHRPPPRRGGGKGEGELAKRVTAE